jgi:hypothetical protein
VVMVVMMRASVHGRRLSAKAHRPVENRAVRE